MQIWQELGKELSAIHLFISAVMCDREYQKILGKRQKNHFGKIYREISKLRSDCEERMYTKGICDIGVFYGNGNEMSIKDIRDIAKRMGVTDEP